MMKFGIAIIIIYALSAFYSVKPLAASSPVPFVDTDGHWAQSYISWAVDEHLAAGYEDGSFQPNRPISEPEFLAMLLRAYSLVPQASESGSSWHKPYYEYAEEHGWPVTYVTSSHVFQRGQAAQLLASAAVGKAFTETEAIKWLLDEGISNGRTSATVSGFDANSLLSRAEALTFFYKLKLHSPSLSSVRITPAGYTLGGISIGDYGQRLEHLLGVPTRIEASGYNFAWHIYNTDKSYKQYLMIGMQSNRVVALFSGSKSVWQAKTGIVPGITIAEAKTRTGTVGQAAAHDDYYAYISEGVHTTLFIDRKDGNKISGMLLVDSASMNADYSKPSETLQAALEQQSFDLTNAERAKRGISLLTWDKLAAASARSHSVDMGNRDFFAHTNLNGKSPFDRMKAMGVRYMLAAENIAAGYNNSIYAHYGWMNSDSGHRETLLNSKLEKLGTGVGFGNSNSTYSIYYTQDFYTP
ncbi:CAP domain-containing protein [Paenibacillus sp. YIM B09110]|uniref:CAP domain-containing protein n=1 Tax=Paenibacillus sp. YIM B09110 TaxID=3126102 RepID=UPI00301C898F